MYPPVGVRLLIAGEDPNLKVVSMLKGTCVVPSMFAIDRSGHDWQAFKQDGKREVVVKVS